jgi:hypothetical protein
LALVVEKLIKYLERWHSAATVIQIANLVNLHFPDARGFIDETLHESRFAFKSDGSAYYAVPEKCKIYYNPKKSEALNPKFVFSGHTKEVDFSREMKSTLLIYRQPRTKKEANDWKAKAAANKKAKEENVDELLAATRDNSRSTFGLGNLGSDSSNTPRRSDPYEVTSEEPKQHEQQAVKIETLDDIKKLSKERKPKPKKAKKPPKKKRKEPATRGIW